MPTNPNHFKQPHDGVLEIYFLGCLDFDAALFLQERSVFEISGRNDRNGVLFLYEHPPLITIGREGSRSQILRNPRELEALQIETRWLGRGGGCVFHSPGQLVASPIVPLDRIGFGITDFRTALEQSLIETAGYAQVPAMVDPKSRCLLGRSGQLASVGVAVKSWVSYHGLFLDVTPTISPLDLIKPLGDDTRLCPLAAQSGNVVTMSQVRESLARHIAHHLGYTATQTYTSHPLLKRTIRKVPVHA